MEQLEEVHRELLDMGALCEEAIRRCVRALTEGNSGLAAAIMPLDAETDRLERLIEELCLGILLRQQPVACDFRHITAAMKMVTDLERIGDQAADIGRIVVRLNGRRADGRMPLVRLAEKVMWMVSRGIDAYVGQSMEIALEVVRGDDRADELFGLVRGRLVGAIALAPDDGEYFLDLLLIAKYLERIGDHAVNIAEWVIFSITGTRRRGRPGKALQMQNAPDCKI